MSRRAIVLLTVMAVISVACTGVVWAQDSGRTLKPGSASQQSAESIIPGRYIVVLEDDGGGETAAQASADRRQAGQVAEDLAQEDKIQGVGQT